MMWFVGALALMFLSFNFIIYFEKESQVRYLIKEQNYVKDEIALDKIITENDRRIKITSFYASIIATYGVKYHPGKKRDRQGLNHYQKADFILTTYKLCKLLDIPYMLPMSIAGYESGFIPAAETDYETGIFQHRPVAVAQAFMYYHQLPAAYKKQCAFVYTSAEDLKDPVNALKIQMVLLWGLKKDFDNNEGFYVSGSHWGTHLIYPLYKKGITIPDEFVFNKGTIKEDARNPLMYYYIINAYKSRFDMFSLKVWIENDYVARYKRQASKSEVGFLDGWKYAQDLLKTAKEVEINNTKYEEEQERLIRKYNEKIKTVETEYRRIHGLMKEGKFDKIKDLFKLGRSQFFWLVGEVNQDNISEQKKFLIKIYISAIIIFLLIFLFGLIEIIKYGVKLCLIIIRKRKK